MDINGGNGYGYYGYGKGGGGGGRRTTDFYRRVPKEMTEVSIFFVFFCVCMFFFLFYMIGGEKREEG